jgi:hypothetical protein
MSASMVVWLILALQGEPPLRAPDMSRARGDSAELELAAAAYASEHLLRQFAGKRLALETRQRSGGKRTASQLSALAQILHAVPTVGDSVIRCSGGPGTCRLRGFDALVSLNVQSLGDSQAEVGVMVNWPSGQKRMAIYEHEPTLLFEKRDGRWRFVRISRVRDT